MEFTPIGIIRTPFADAAGMPIQPSGAAGVLGRVEMYPQFQEGLADLAGFSHIHLLYHFHRAPPCTLTVMPFLDSRPHGIFATRSPPRPNPMGISVVRLVRVEGCTLDVEGVDILDGTPLLDIKPYVPAFDRRNAERIGWLEGREHHAVAARADGRFKNPAAGE